jgi:hypothetical protein
MGLLLKTELSEATIIELGPADSTRHCVSNARHGHIFVHASVVPHTLTIFLPWSSEIEPVHAAEWPSGTYVGVVWRIAASL